MEPSGVCLDAPELTYWLQSHYLHETFDRLSGRCPEERSRTDTIPNSVFKRLHDWLSTESIRKLETVRNNFLAHAADEVSRGGTRYEGMRFVELDEAQRAIIRVGRAVNPCSQIGPVSRKHTAPRRSSSRCMARLYPFQSVRL